MRRGHRALPAAAPRSGVDLLRTHTRPSASEATWHDRITTTLLLCFFGSNHVVYNDLLSSYSEERYFAIHVHTYALKAKLELGF